MGGSWEKITRERDDSISSMALPRAGRACRGAGQYNTRHKYRDSLEKVTEGEYYFFKHFIFTPL